MSPDCPQALVSQGSAEQGLLSIETFSPRSGGLVSLPNTPKNLWWELWSPLSPSVSERMVGTSGMEKCPVDYCWCTCGVPVVVPCGCCRTAGFTDDCTGDPSSPFPGYLMAIFKFPYQGDYFTSSVTCE